MILVIIFLDIDGVLATAEYWHKNKQLDPACVYLLNSFCNKYNASVVVSSAWRTGHTLDSIKSKLEKHGILVNLIGMTPKYREGRSEVVVGGRGNEILDWIKANKYKGDYFVIDDDIRDFQGIILKEKIIHVNSALTHGALNHEHIKLMERLLEQKNLC